MTQTKAELLQTRHQGDIRLGDADSSHYVGFKAPATVGTSLVWTLPAADGTAGYYLKTDGSGNLGWSIDNSGVSLSGSTNNTIATVTGANALQGENDLTFDGNTLTHTVAANSHRIQSLAAGNHYTELRFDSNRSSAADTLSVIDFRWDGTTVVDILAVAGADTTNKDDGILAFRTSASAGGIAERMRIDSSGKVGIGETTMDALLVIKGDSDANTTPSIRLKDGSDTREAWISNTAGDLVLANGGDDNTPHCELKMFDGNIMRFNTANTERMRLDPSGYFLVGHTASEAMYYTGRIQVQGTNSTTSAITIKTNQADSGGPALVLGKSRGALGSATAVNDDDVLGHIFFNGADGTDTVSYGAEIRCQVDGTPGSNDMPGRLTFFTTADGAATATERLRISSTGVSKFTGGVSQAATAMGALDLDLRTSNYFTKTISGNSTFTFSNPAASGTVTAFTLELTHSSGTVTWPSEVKWNADTAPTLTTGKTHLFMFVTDDAGSRYRGSALVDYVN